jgi:hypothetical protein
VLGAVFHFKGNDLPAYLGNQINLPILLTAPVGEAHVLRVVASEKVPEGIPGAAIRRYSGIKFSV